MERLTLFGDAVGRLTFFGDALGKINILWGCCGKINIPWGGLKIYTIWACFLTKTFFGHVMERLTFFGQVMRSSKFQDLHWKNCIGKGRKTEKKFPTIKRQTGKTENDFGGGGGGENNDSRLYIDRLEKLKVILEGGGGEG